MKILLPVFGMADSQLIFDFVRNYHWPSQTVFKLLHVLGSSETDTAVLEAQKKATELLSEISHKLTVLVPESEVSWEIISGAPTYEIIELSLKWKADMIVMGYRTRSDIQGFMAGSVSKGVVMQAPCSVAIIRPPL
jgi:nucleotide-binding universal stress UspA family protein